MVISEMYALNDFISNQPLQIRLRLIRILSHTVKVPQLQRLHGLLFKALLNTITAKKG